MYRCLFPVHKVLYQNVEGQTEGRRNSMRYQYIDTFQTAAAAAQWMMSLEVT